MAVGKPFTKETAARYGAKGGVKSAEVRRNKRELRDFVKIMLEQQVAKRDDGTPITGAEAMAIKLVQEAIKGDWKAWELARDTAGQKPVDKVVSVGVNQSVIDDVEKAIKAANGGSESCTTNEKE